MQRDSRASSDGKHRYTLVMGLPPGPRVFIGPRGLPLPALVILVLSSGIACYFLSWYLTKPIVRLRAATQKLAAGDLTARTGAPVSNRRDEVASLTRDFDAMAERLETLVKAQSRLLNDISHELRSPLARLNVALGLARQRAGVESVDMLDRIELEASRLNELIGRILTLARLEDGEQEVPQTPVPLDELVANIAEDAEFEAQARHCHVHTVIPEGDWGVRGNASLLHSAVENVVRNAIRYTQEHSPVEIELESIQGASGPEAVLTVSDSGPGVPARCFGKAFRTVLPPRRCPRPPDRRRRLGPGHHRESCSLPRRQSRGLQPDRGRSPRRNSPSADLRRPGTETTSRAGSVRSRSLRAGVGRPASGVSPCVRPACSWSLRVFRPTPEA